MSFPLPRIPALCASSQADREWRSGGSVGGGSKRARLDRMANEQDDRPVPSPPSTLNLDRSASAVRSGRSKLDRLADELTHTDATLAGGDVEGDAQSAYAVGDE